MENLTVVSGDVITLYAIYAREKYINNGDIVFDGSNKFDGKKYIDTGIYLFNERNINRDFEVSFEIKERVSTGGQATMMSAMNESGSPWPGIVYRIKNQNTDQIAVNSTKNYMIEQDYNNANKITFFRKKGIIYLKFNDEEETVINDLSLIATPFDFPVTFGASLNGSLVPQRIFNGTLSNLKVIVSDIDNTTGLVNFDANGGDGNKFTQTIVPNTTTNLKANTYTRGGFRFECWNTQANGKGIDYKDQQDATNIVKPGEKITLYAKWKKIYYNVEFNANGGDGSMSSQTIEGAKATKLKASGFKKDGYSFAFWNTKSNGLGTSYENEEEVTLTGTSENITLYAFYEKFSYTHEGEFVFEGSTYDNTDIYLFSAKNAKKDFKISFTVKSSTYEKNQNTILSAINEVGNPFQGFVFRMNRDVENQYELEANSTKSKETRNFYDLDDTHNVIIKRTDNILYINIDNAGDTQIIDYSALKNPFYYHLTIGAGLDGNFNVWRYFKGTLSDIKVELYE